MMQVLSGKIYLIDSRLAQCFVTGKDKNINTMAGSVIYDRW